MGTVETFPVRGWTGSSAAPPDAGAQPARDDRHLAECRAAVALAELAGEPLETMPGDRFADYRRRAVFAMLLGLPDGRRLGAYLLAHAIGRERRSIVDLEHHLKDAIEALAGFDAEVVRWHAATLDGPQEAP